MHTSKFIVNGIQNSLFCVIIIVYLCLISYYSAKFYAFGRRRHCIARTKTIVAVFIVIRSSVHKITETRLATTNRSRVRIQ